MEYNDDLTTGVNCKYNKKNEQIILLWNNKKGMNNKKTLKGMGENHFNPHSLVFGDKNLLFYRLPKASAQLFFD